jgi:hypothetical protein
VRELILRRRTLLYAALALAVPLPALALSGGGGSSDLNAAASLDGCGVASSTIVCQIDVSWSAVEGASSYSASVTSPDGSVVDYGSVSGTSTSLYVPYVGNGTYSVSVSAYGTPPGADKPEVISRDSADAGGSATAKPTISSAGAPDASAGVTETPSTDQGDTTTTTTTSTTTPTTTTPAEPLTDPTCDETSAQPDQPAQAESTADTTTTAAAPSAGPCTSP